LNDLRLKRWPLRFAEVRGIYGVFDRGAGDFALEPFAVMVDRKGKSESLVARRCRIAIELGVQGRSVGRAGR